jgi:hypothetical protein
LRRRGDEHSTRVPRLAALSYEFNLIHYRYISTSASLTYYNASCVGLETRGHDAARSGLAFLHLVVVIFAQSWVGDSKREKRLRPTPLLRRFQYKFVLQDWIPRLRGNNILLSSMQVLLLTTRGK